jgi:hypothetical protein
MPLCSLLLPRACSPRLLLPVIVVAAVARPKTEDCNIATRTWRAYELEERVKEKVAQDLRQNTAELSIKYHLSRS